MKEHARQNIQFDIILLDANMPGMNGFTFAEKIRHDKDLKDITIMMLTSMDIYGGLARCKELGIEAFLVKPVRQEDVIKAIAQTLNGKRITGRSITAQTLSNREDHSTKFQSKGKILLAEDNPVNQRLAIALLEKKGYNVVCVSNGIEVIKALEKNDDYNIILMDVQMPEMSGLEATRIIRDREKLTGKHIPIIAMTAYAMESDREKCKEAGMDEYISKPLDTEELYRVVKKYIDHGNPAIDLNGLLKAVNHDHELVDELVQILLTSYPVQLEEMARAIELGDSVALGKRAHAFKGAISNFGAPIAYEIAKGLERMGREGEIDEAARALEELRNEMERIAQHLLDLDNHS